MVEPPESTMFCAHGRELGGQPATAPSTHLVQAAAHVDRRLLDHGVDNLGQRREEVRRGNLRVEEDFGSEEALVADVDTVLLLARRGVSASVGTQGGYLRGL
jgi:hypothetical protein